MENKFLPVNFLKNENGSAILFALIIMVALTLVGFYLINDSSVETRITRNLKIYKTNLYRSELAIKEAIQRMEDASNPSVQLNPLKQGVDSWDWVISKTSLKQNITDDDWNDKDGDGFPPMTNLFSSDDENRSARYFAVKIGYAPSNNLDMTASGGKTTLMYEYKIYSRGSVEEGSEFKINAGYWKRY